MQRRVAEAVAHKGIELEELPAQVVDITEDELMREFMNVMHEWNFKCFRLGQVRLPYLGEVNRSLSRARFRPAC